MDCISLVIVIASSLIVGGSIIGFFISKGKGFGPFNTATLLLLIVLYFGVLIYVKDGFSSKDIYNLLFAVAGYAGGLLVSKRDVSKNPDKNGSIDTDESSKKL